MEKEQNFNKYDAIDTMLQRYCADPHDAEAVDFLRAKALESDDFRRYIRENIEIAFSSAVAASAEEFDADNAYSRFRQRIGKTAESKRHPSARTIALRFLRVAAIVAAAVVLPWMGYRYATSQQPDMIANITVTTPEGSRSQVTLPDGTKVWLNAGSCITYSQQFGIADRKVTLSGEACFDVTHNEELPFVVSSEAAKVTVLGTYFTVSDYPEDGVLSVDLIRGRVDLASNKTSQHQQLTCNERVIMEKATGRMTKRKIDAANSDAWTHGEINFDEVPLEQIAKTLERTYAAKIEIDERLRNKPFYYSFNSDGTTLNQVLTTLSRTHRLKFKKVDDPNEKNAYLIY